MKTETWKDLRRGDWVAGGFVMAVVFLFGVAIGEWAFVGVAAIAGWGTAVTRNRYLHRLALRSEAANLSPWDVELNGVKIGEIADSEYAAIRLEVFEDMRNYVAQVLNLVRVAIRLIDSMFIAVPAMAFWCAVVVGISAPDIYSTVINELRNATPAAITAGAVTAARFIVIAGVIGAMINAVVFGARYGFINHFAEDTAKRLRRRLNAAAEGRIVLVRWINGIPVFNDERDVLKTSNVDNHVV